MAKNVFQPTEIYNLTREQRIRLDPPVFESEEDLADAIEEYTGPTADDLRREAEAFKAEWDKEKAAMLARAEEQADAIRKEAEKTAFEQVKQKTDEVLKDKQRAEEEAARIREEAETEAAAILEEARREEAGVREAAREEGHREGREAGFAEGRDEVDRLVQRLHVIMDTAIDKRVEIINETETQLVDLVLLISRKVVKVISENQKNVVINNVVQALRKLKSRGDVVIRVNLADLDLTTDHVKDFMKMVENVKSVTVLEDSSVDRGGCVIETDFGQIDARISSQFKEIEEKILELVPIKAKGE